MSSLLIVLSCVIIQIITSNVLNFEDKDFLLMMTINIESIFLHKYMPVRSGPGRSQEG